jgi:prolyl-tRNA editing enzyme YbaK/EbsC (Cys-tRNA(Pro) deacylase)
MPISKKILNYLGEKKYKYELVEHKTTYTAWDTVRTAQKHQKKIKPEEIVKTLVMKADKDYVLALVPGNRKIDKKKLLQTINTVRKRNKLAGAKKIDFAKEVWMKKSLPGKVGATPPFRGLLALDIFMDSILMKQRSLYLGSGEYEYSIKLPTKQFVKNEAPIKGVFSMKK